MSEKTAPINYWLVDSPSLNRRKTVGKEGVWSPYRGYAIEDWSGPKRFLRRSAYPDVMGSS